MAVATQAAGEGGGRGRGETRKAGVVCEMAVLHNFPEREENESG